MTQQAHDDVGDDYGDEDDTCQRCAGAGGFHDCGEDTCCCADPGGDGDHDWWMCPDCDGTGREG